MKLRKLSTSLLVVAALSLAAPVFADKVGVTFGGDAALETAISDSLKAEGHEIVDISASVQGVKIDSVAAASIGKATGAEIIVSGKKLGSVIVLKVLSTKNDTVVGGTTPADKVDAAAAQVKKIISDNKDKLAK